MSTLTVKFRGVQEDILNTMVNAGIAETKSEALRMALLHFGLEMGVVDERQVVKLIRTTLAEATRKPSDVARVIKRVKDASVPRQ